jgi:hypothetical protein
MARTPLSRNPHSDPDQIFIALTSYATMTLEGAPAFVTAGERQRGGKGSLVAQHPQWWIPDGASGAEIAQARVREGIPA